ncbi:exopolysaccharide biosynthesis protein [Chelativorans sp. SCAU2101]|uniref:Exopolysaccharide biosynthesis protein n=1 Tax=Chelativorans petroleitrophicus TaxID=2975484 RepID=A0A9X2X8L8_9HYPH|nr:exopolysaccharide biosynthesis protein [Chelativorans petroleitrophicus]MCT8990723.1 exopolysaccharide biosynthesis protein [Chelativorans petroleitrophicus]
MAQKYGCGVKAEGSALETVSRAGKAGSPPRRLSSIFEELAHAVDDRITVEQLRDALGDRSFATLLVFFALVNLLPLPPGSTFITGIPLVLISVQMALGRRTAWLPRFILEKSMAAEQFRHLSERLVPKMRWVERFIRPRYWPFARDHADRVIGCLTLVLALAILMPIPFGNWFPAFSCVLMGLANSERDGVLFVVSIVSGILSLALAGLVVGGAGVLASVLIG